MNNPPTPESILERSRLISELVMYSEDPQNWLSCEDALEIVDLIETQAKQLEVAKKTLKWYAKQDRDSRPRRLARQGMHGYEDNEGEAEKTLANLSHQSDE